MFFRNCVSNCSRSNFRRWTKKSRKMAGRKKKKKKTIHYFLKPISSIDCFSNFSWYFCCHLVVFLHFRIWTTTVLTIKKGFFESFFLEMISFVFFLALVHFVVGHEDPSQIVGSTHFFHSTKSAREFNLRFVGWGLVELMFCFVFFALVGLSIKLLSRFDLNCMLNREAGLLLDFPIRQTWRTLISLHLSIVNK